MFLVSSLFPVPVLAYLIVVKGFLYGAQIGTTMEIGVKHNKISKCQATVMETLLKQYRKLNIHGVGLTCIGPQQLYRIDLVWCHTYVKEPLPRLCSMTTLSIVMTFTTVFVRPYKENPANNTIVLSCACTVCIAIVNLAKAATLSVHHDHNALVKMLLDTWMYVRTFS